MKEHTGAKPFHCSLCDKSFTQPGSLNTHMRLHTGERPYSCRVCAKPFAQASSLSMHMRQHRNGGVQQRPLPPSPPHLNRSLPPLPLLPAITNANAAMARRSSVAGVASPLALTPVGNKQFQCPVCLKCYSSAAYLTKHVEAHGIQAAVVQLKRMRHQHRLQQRQEREERMNATANRMLRGSSYRSQQTHARTETAAAAAAVMPCPMCPQRVPGGPVALLLHIGRDHKVSNALKCWECTAVFSESGAFMQHLREHTDRQAQRM